MRSCDRCGKGTQVGMNVSHSHIRTKKRFLPNLHALRVKVGDISKRQTFCTKCLRTVKKEQTVVSEKLAAKAESKAALNKDLVTANQT